MKLEVKNLSFSYSGNSVLKKISFELKNKEVMCVAGPNGSGKSTLVKCINKILRPDSGKILMDGTDLSILDFKEIAKKTAYVPQSGGAVFSSSVFETVLMGRSPYFSWNPGEEDLDKTIDTIRLLGLSEIASKNYNSLSGGQQQKVLTARAVAQEPELLLLDEPTSALDICHQLEVMETVTQLAEIKNISVLMVIHDLNLAARFASKAILLKNGKIFSSGIPENVFTSKNIAGVFEVDTEIKISNKGLVIVPIGRCLKNNTKTAVKKPLFEPST